MSRLDEQQRRWLAALESKKAGHGGDTLLAQVTGLHVDTIRRGRPVVAAGRGDALLGRGARAALITCSVKAANVQLHRGG
jgi:hypothetical protein